LPDINGTLMRFHSSTERFLWIPAFNIGERATPSKVTLEAKWHELAEATKQEAKDFVHYVCA